MTIWSQFRILGRFLGVCVSISLSGKLKIDGQHLVLDVTFCCFYNLQQGIVHFTETTFQYKLLQRINFIYQHYT